MASERLGPMIKTLDARLERVEQILPTLATKAELREEGERTRRHMDIAVEQMESRLRLAFEGHAAERGRVDQLEARNAAENDAELEAKRRGR